MVADKGRAADGILGDSGVDCGTDGTTTISPTVQSLAAVLGGDSSTGVEAIRGAVLYVDGPDIAIVKSGSDTIWSPGIDAVIEGDLDDLVRSSRVLGGGLWPLNVLIPVDLAGGGPVWLIFVVANATVAKDEIFAGGLGLSKAKQGSGGEASGELDAGHHEWRRECRSVCLWYSCR